MASAGIAVPAAPGARERLLHLTFALGVAAFFWAFVAGLVYLLSVAGALPLRTDPLSGARQRDSRGDTAGALRQYRLATLIDPNDLRALNEMGELLARAGRHDESLAAFESVLRFRPDGRALAGIGSVLAAEGRHAEAADVFERSLVLAPNQPAALNQLGVARVRLGELEGAIKAFEAGAAIAPSSPARGNLQRARAELARRQKREQ